MSTATTTATSVGARLQQRCAHFGDSPAFRYPDPGLDGAWQSLTWTELAARVTELTAGLLALGVTPGQRLAIAATTRIEWVLADLAIMSAGAVTVTVYPNTNADDVAHILDDSGAVLVFAENAAQVAKLRTPDGGWIAGVRDVITFDPAGDPSVRSLREIMTLGVEVLDHDPGRVHRVLETITPDQLATIVYTSGTTGRPKGVELTHANWLYLGAATAAEDFMRRDHLHFLWLPLSHVFGKLLLANQYEVGYVTAIDGRIDRIIDNLAAIRPTAMAAAPRIFEKIYARVTATATAGGGLSAALFRWAIRVGATRQDPSRPWWQRLQLAAADALVFTKVRDRLGGRLELLISGSAPLAPQISSWFAAAGLPIIEGYGLTEATGVSFFNRPGRLRIGTVGQALTGTEVRIADDGEILLRGPSIMRGYRHLPDQTADIIDADGWLATGDIGELDADGYLRITDRKKDLVKTSGGKYIAPSAIESAVKAACPLVSAAIMIAAGRNFASLLVTIDPDTSRDMSADQVRATVAAAVAEVNARLNPWETIKQFRILPRELSVEAGEVTPSLKVKRAAVNRNYADLIDAIYRGEQAGPPPA
ncbi:AMP-dependent synthetase/ligase [Actinoplanes teichomyceticus]|uniref:Long-chain acyl-CoA synthetase n=1 Tax=Actinoplanes teichomyceticus TaxID=1867 RepID=A0A561VLG0_ACTTI|nr:long-chain fatty acid--CoA ligase [Actinoplanes teichomyceticus]TWG12437.1 long-chain acyl-CoA synthetase [Actinoplanes teichomyceticus]GIF13798.1 AMP-dependent synthetase [Actinoplanes teichomyceticus]